MIRKNSSCSGMKQRVRGRAEQLRLAVEGIMTGL